jgi:5-carboxymethyl-2-hydroxymuconic-semialdehyde dehydrogenase
LKRVHFELGGKNPVIVFADADFDRALDAVLFMIYSLNGERCTSSSRALVEASIYDDFAKRAAERDEEDQGRPSARSRDRDRPADPSAPSSTRFCRYQAAQAKGAPSSAAAARARRQLRRADALSRCAQHHEIAQEEIFGPVLTMMPFADEQRRWRSPTTCATARRLSVDEGCRARASLCASVEAGMVWVNSRTCATCRRRSAA